MSSSPTSRRFIHSNIHGSKFQSEARNGPGYQLWLHVFTSRALEYVSNLSYDVGKIEITSAPRPTAKQIMAALESSIPKNAIRAVSIDIYRRSWNWSDAEILSLIQILCVHQTEIMSLAFRHDKWIRKLIMEIRDWTKDSSIDSLILSIPSAEDRSLALVTSLSNLKSIYLNRSAYTIQLDEPFSDLTRVYMSCNSSSVNKFARWLVNLKDLRLKLLWIDDPLDESLQMKALKRLYIGRVSSVVGDYLVKLVSACPKVSLL
jgi:hypothetical protein